MTQEEFFDDIANFIDRMHYKISLLSFIPIDVIFITAIGGVIIVSYI